jgi:hypothetical protein
MENETRDAFALCWEKLRIRTFWQICQLHDQQHLEKSFKYDLNLHILGYRYVKYNGITTIKMTFES